MIAWKNVEQSKTKSVKQINQHKNVQNDHIEWLPVKGIGCYYSLSESHWSHTLHAFLWSNITSNVFHFLNKHLNTWNFSSEFCHECVRLHNNISLADDVLSRISSLQSKQYTNRWSHTFNLFHIFSLTCIIVFWSDIVLKA